LNDAYLITNLSVSVTDAPRIFNVNASFPTITQFEYLNISCYIFDIDGIENVYLNSVGPMGYHKNISIVSNNTGLNYYYNQTYQTPGRYFFYIWSNDSTGNASFTDWFDFIITDIPVIPNVWSSKNVSVQNTSLNISCLVYDYEGLNNLSINITNPRGLTQNISILDNQTGDIYYSNRIYETLGTYTYYIWTRDNVGNTNRSAVKQFSIIRS